MNIFQNKKIRYLTITLLAILQVVCLTIIPKPYSDYLFYFVNILYFFLGLFSIDWNQAIRNIFFVTIPTIVLIFLVLLLIPFIYGTSIDMISISKMSLQLWVLVLIIALPVFLLGFGLRTLILLRTKKQKNYK